MPPLLLDLFLWLGPRLALPLDSARFNELWQQLSAPEASLSQAQRFWEQYNLFYTLSPAPVFGIPSLMVHKMTADAPWTRLVWPVTSDLQFLVTLAALLVLALALAALYLYRITQALRDHINTPLPAPAPLPVLMGRFMKLAALIVPPVLLGLGLLLLLSIGLIPQGVGQFLLLVVLTGTIYLGVHLVLAVPSLMMLSRRPFDALRESLLVLQVDFLRVMLLGLLIFVLYEGLNWLWMAPEATTWLLLLGIAGHAFIATGLTVALFVFYMDRLAYVRALQKAWANLQQARMPRQS